MIDKDQEILKLERKLEEEISVKKSEVMRNTELLQQVELLQHNIEKLIQLQEDQAKEIAKYKFLLKKKSLED